MASQYMSEADRMAYEINRDGYADAAAARTYSPLTAETRQAIALERIADAVEALVRGVEADLISRGVIEAGGWL